MIFILLLTSRLSLLIFIGEATIESEEGTSNCGPNMWQEVAAIRLAWWSVCAVKDETFFTVIGGKSDKELRDLMSLKSVVVLKCMIQL